MESILTEDDKSNKIDVLKHLYSHIHSEMQEYRATEMKAMIAIGGMIFVITGWAATKTQDLGQEGLLVLSGGVVLLFFLLMGITNKLNKYFIESAQVINKIEHIFRAYDSGFFIGDGELWESKMLLPESWKDFGKASWKEPIFVFAKYFSIFLSLFSLIAIYFSYSSLIGGLESQAMGKIEISSENSIYTISSQIPIDSGLEATILRVEEATGKTWYAKKSSVDGLTWVLINEP